MNAGRHSGNRQPQKGARHAERRSRWRAPTEAHGRSFGRPVPAPCGAAVSRQGHQLGCGEQAVGRDRHLRAERRHRRLRAQVPPEAGLHLPLAGVRSGSTVGRVGCTTPPWQLLRPDRDEAGGRRRRVERGEEMTMKHHHSLRPGSAFAVPPISRWRKDLWGPGTYIYDSRKHDQRFEVFRGDSPRGTYAGRGYTPGKWFARTFFYGLVPYTLARRENSEWGGTYDFEHEAR